MTGGRTRVLVLAGSPKGNTSVTMAYVEWLRKSFPSGIWKVEQISSRSRLLENNMAAFDSVIAAVGEADLILWAVPLYVFTVPSQYKRFIELVYERDARYAFAGKYAAILTTSVHFYDHLSQQYLREVSEDLGMMVAGSISPGMFDLNKTGGVKALGDFGRTMSGVVDRKLVMPRFSVQLPDPLPRMVNRDHTGEEEPRRHVPGQLYASRPVFRSAGRIAILVDEPDGPVGAMAGRFADAVRVLAVPADSGSAGISIDVVGLPSIHIAGGCMGCLRCGVTDHCVYEGKDGFIDMYRQRLMTADVIVFAVTLRDRGVSSTFKRFLDRGFFNTHRRSFRGAQMVFLVSGALSLAGTVYEMIHAYAEWQGANLVDIVSDEPSPGVGMGDVMDSVAIRTLEALQHEAHYPATFLGVAGMKVFRDEVYGNLRIVFKGDHREYRRSGVYDFPQRDIPRMAALWAGYWVTSIPFIARGMASGIKKAMVANLARAVAAARPLEGQGAPVPEAGALPEHI